MKTRLTSATYLGYTAMDKRFSNAMLPWLLREIRSTKISEKLSLTIEDGCLKAYNGNFEPVIVHRLVDIIRASQVPGRPHELFYILINEKESLLNCFLFRASTDNEVAELFTQMREPSPGAVSARSSTGSVGGSVMKNIGFQQMNSSEHLPWSSPAISLPGNCSSNLTNESPLVRSTSNASALTSLSADLSPSDSHFFEVLYIGKVRISQRKVPESLIDDALRKFSLHEVEKARNARRHSLLSSTGTSLYSNNSNESLDDKQTNSQETNKKTNIAVATTPLEPDKDIAWKSVEHLPNVDKDFDVFTKERVEKTTIVINKPNQKPLEPSVLILNVPKNNLGTVNEDEEKNDDSSDSMTRLSDVSLSKSDKVDVSRQDSPPFDRKCVGLKRGVLPENRPFMRDRSASIGALNVKTPIAQLIGEQNRTMLFQIGRTELRLISPDRKQVLLHRAFKDVASCVLGRINKEHFGFVCRENSESYACYVFKCESDSIATEVVNAIRQAFVAHAELVKKSHEQSPNMTCEHCPLLWYHRLCHDIEGMNDKKTHAFILRRVEQLSDDEQEVLVTKYQGGTNHMYETSDHNAFLMMLLRAHCEAKQLRHVHDTAENRSEFLNQYLGGSTIFMKAKRSLSSGFDHLLKRKASRDEGNVVVNMKKESSPIPSLSLEPCSAPAGSELLSPDVNRCKSLSPAVDSTPPSPKTSMPSPFDDDDEKDEPTTPVNSPMMDIFLKVSDTRATQAPAGVEPEATWRQVIFDQVRHTEGHMDGETNQTDQPKGKRTKEQFRQLWKMAIEQTVLLVRMEKENAKLKEKEESSFVRRIKLDYPEAGACDAGAGLLWDSLLADYNTRHHKVDKHMLMQAVIQGVPRTSRGGVWYFLAEQAALRSPPPAAARFPLYQAPYRELLHALTKHHHAILIDLGRTFPKHSYFASALGPGQLALYNILKAYSLLDPEVGYCQGLSFIAGVLLLHMDEGEAFVLLRHLMFRRGLRKQYLPDMSGLQVQLYQFSRLLRDHEPELHARLERLDISPALYAAPWMLTLFTSQFPLGFVVRVFDLIFLDSLDIVFAVSLALLTVHKDGVMLCENCEEAAEYLKHKLPDMSNVTYEKIMRKVQALDISRQLSEYAVEYAVLREEMPRMATLTEENRRLVKDTDRMLTEMDSAMEAINSYQKNQSRLEAQNKNMEQQLALLSRYVTAHRQDLPADIKKVVQQHTKKITFSSKIFNKSYEEDDPKKNLKTGISAPNLFSKITREDVLNAVNRTKSSPEKDKRFMMKKSNSVHSGLIKNSLNVLEENEPNSRTESLRNDVNLKESLKELGRKSSGYFANTHEQIRIERLFEQQLKHDFDENLKKSVETKTNDVNDFQGRRSMSLNFNAQELKSDSGFVTPISPERKESIVSHPLSDCDVDIKFDGQLTKLKQIRPLRSNAVDSKQA